jgi:hypothetical protein
MKQKILFYLVVLSSVISSCDRVSFLYPLSEKKSDKVFKEELLGEWKDSRDSDNNAGTTFLVDSMLSDDSAMGYSITIIDTSQRNFEDSSFLKADLVSLGQKLFLVSAPDFEQKMNEKMGIYNAAFILPSYHVIRIFKLTPDSIVFGELNYDNLIRLINAKKIFLKHELIEKGDLLILEKTEVLQRKLPELEKFPGVYDHEVIYRVKNR